MNIRNIALGMTVGLPVVAYVLGAVNPGEVFGYVGRTMNGYAPEVKPAIVQKAERIKEGKLAEIAEFLTSDKD